jgi:LDH2 family malate/lactate/ureidoglycolate dehydrogenase
MTERNSRLTAAALQGFGAALLVGAGARQTDADSVAAHLVGAILAGPGGAGIGLLPSYLDQLRGGLVDAASTDSVLADTAVLLRVDANGGWGAPACERMIDRAGAKALEHGLAAATLANAHDLGRIGAYGERAARSGLAAMIFVNVTDQTPIVAPFHGSDARFGTNPVCIAFPATSQRATFLLDMATSRISLGTVQQAAARGQTVPAGSLLDANGMPTTDPTGMVGPDYKGAIRPAGQHKGYGLAFACELFAGVLSGGGTIQPEHPRRGGIRNGLFAILINPASFGDPDWMEHEIEAMASYALASPPIDWDSPVLYPGDPERALRGKRERDGIPLDAVTVKALNAAAMKLRLKDRL